LKYIKTAIPTTIQMTSTTPQTTGEGLIFPAAEAAAEAVAADQMMAMMEAEAVVDHTIPLVVVAEAPTTPITD
jgi:hypothetical protein